MAGDKRVAIVRDHIARIKMEDGIRAAFTCGFMILSFAGVQGLPARAFIRNTLRQNPIPSGEY